MKKVSIIVPVYNAEKFIDICVKSLVNQTYKNIEIFLINDGSKDRSLKKIKEWKKKYPNIIKVLSHDNCGVGKTRNKGIDESTGDYIVFVDADDYIDLDFVEVMISKIKNNDVIVSGYRKHNLDDKIIYFERKLSDNSTWDKYRQLVIWAKMYKTSFIKKNNIRFNDLKMGEDIVFSLTTISKSQRFITTSYVGYNNVENMDSVTHNNTIRKDNDLVNLVRTTDEILGINKTLIKTEYNYIKYYYLKTLALYIVDKSNVLSYNDLKIFYNELMNEIKAILNKNKSKVAFCWQKTEPLKVNIMINLVVFMDKIHLSKLLLFIFSKAKLEYK